MTVRAAGFALLLVAGGFWLVGCGESEPSGPSTDARIVYQRLVTISGYTDGPWIGDIVVMSGEGRDKTNLTRNRVNGEDQDPVWSPDGTKLRERRRQLRARLRHWRAPAVLVDQDVRERGP
jgi:hypothetical protein